MNRTIKYAYFEDMTWPLPDSELEWKLRYAQQHLTKEELLQCASILGAYHQMVLDPTTKRQMVVKNIRLQMIEAYERDKVNS